MSIIEDTAHVRDTYLVGARALVQLLGAPVLRDQWTAPSVLEGWSCGLVAGHVARSVLQVEWFLDADEPSVPTVTAVDYYAALTGVRDAGSALNTGVRARSEEMAALGWSGLLTETTASLDRLDARLPVEPPTRCVEAFGRPMLLDQYLRTRTVELSIHGDDLALSLGVDGVIPDACIEAAASVLEDVAFRRHGALAVLRALARRERDAAEALRVL